MHPHIRFFVFTSICAIACSARIQTFTTPDQVPTCTPPVVDASGSCALKADGTVWCWRNRRNADGKFDAPLVRIGLSDVTSIRSEFNRGLARDADGSLWSFSISNEQQSAIAHVSGP